MFIRRKKWLAFQGRPGNGAQVVVRYHKWSNLAGIWKEAQFGRIVVRKSEEAHLL